MAPKKPTKATAAAKISRSSASKSRVQPVKAATPKSVLPQPAMAEPAMAGCCAAHAPIEAKRYRCWCNCHLMALLCQRETVLLWIATSVLFLTFNMAWHGALLGPRYLETAWLWLPEAMMQPALFVVADIGIALVFALLFRLAFTGNGGLVEGLKLGLLVMAPVALMMLYAVAALPLPHDILLLWATGALLQGALAGVVGAALAKRSTSCCA